MSTPLVLSATGIVVTARDVPAKTCLKSASTNRVEEECLQPPPRIRPFRVGPADT